MAIYSNLPEKALQLAAQVGETLKGTVPNKALSWVETGAALGAMRTGTRMAGKFVRRNPAMAVAAVAGAGLLWYAAKRRAKQAQDEPIEGTAKRIDAKRGDGEGNRRRSGAGSRNRSGGGSSNDNNRNNNANNGNNNNNGNDSRRSAGAETSEAS